MTAPGKGRYTTYVPVTSDRPLGQSRNNLLWSLFNGRSDKGKFLGETTGRQTDNNAAANAVLARAISNVSSDGIGGISPSNGQQAGDSTIFPSGVNLKYTGAPNLSEVTWDSQKSNIYGQTPTKSGSPANAYVPDISSPGPGKTEGIDKDQNPGITPSDVNPGFNAQAPGAGQASPSVTSENISSPLGKDLKMGNSSV